MSESDPNRTLKRAGSMSLKRQKLIQQQPCYPEFTHN
jgi:hypothetical protein